MVYWFVLFAWMFGKSALCLLCHQQIYALRNSNVLRQFIVQILIVQYSVEHIFGDWLKVECHWHAGGELSFIYGKCNSYPVSHINSIIWPKSTCMVYWFVLFFKIIDAFRLGKLCSALVVISRSMLCSPVASWFKHILFHHTCENGLNKAIMR